MTYLIIKGERDQALAAAKAHNLEPVSEPIEGQVFKETSFEVNTVHYRRVVEWFCEPPHRAPYPTGTLLFYR